MYNLVTPPQKKSFCGMYDQEDWSEKKKARIVQLILILLAQLLHVFCIESFITFFYFSQDTKHTPAPTAR